MFLCLWRKIVNLLTECAGHVTDDVALVGVARRGFIKGLREATETWDEQRQPVRLYHTDTCRQYMQLMYNKDNVKSMVSDNKIRHIL